MFHLYLSFTVSSGKISSFLREYGLHSRNKRITRKIFKRRRVICGYNGHVVMGDLLQFPDNFVWHNRLNGKSFAYILLLVDCFSKKMWCEPLSKKTKEETANALTKIFDSMKAPPTMFVTDGGKGNI